MRRHPFTAAFGAVLVILGFCGLSHAYTYEFHGGVFSSYEYRDNYRGTAHDEESEAIYAVGPSARFLLRGQTASLDLSGHAAKTYHQKYTQDDYNDILLDSRFNTTTSKDTLGLDYSYTQTNQHTILSDITGTSKIHRASANYSRQLTQASTAGLVYVYFQENNPEGDDDLVSHSATGTFTQRLSQSNTANLTLGYDKHDYETEEDTQVTRSALSLDSLITVRTTVGFNLEYQHQQHDINPDSDITSAFLVWGYALNQQTNIRVSGGYNWLSMKGEDKVGTYAARGELTLRTLYDTFTLRASREYRAEFTTDVYGIYDTRSANASWQRFLLRDLNVLSTITYEERRPVSSIEISPISGKEQDFTGIASVNWTPLQYLTVTAAYEHYERIREISDTERENRYRIRAEVLY